MEDLQQIVQIVLAASTFVLVLAIWIGGVLLWAAKRAAKSGRVRRRLGLDRSEPTNERTLHLWHEGRDVTTTIAVRTAASWVRRQERALSQAGLAMGFWHALTLVAGAVLITVAFVMVVSGNIVLALGAAAAIVFGLRILLGMRVNKRQAQFEQQLVDALELAARSLRAGHPLMGAFQLLSEELSPPVSTVFAEICQRHGMGADLEQVLRDAGDDSANTDMKLFATSVAIQVRTGGNLADLMERLALVIRDRMRVHRRARVLTSQTQMSKRVLIALPIILFVVMNVLNPNYMKPFFNETAAQFMLGIGVGLMVIGVIIMNRLSVIRY